MMMKLHDWFNNSNAIELLKEYPDKINWRIYIVYKYPYLKPILKKPYKEELIATRFERYKMYYGYFMNDIELIYYQ
jgi:hypothetical protein|tara:strand:+ start:585 stop:812 length:228 start_codon:yes stop_codon:yes gene_type:complete